MVPRPVQRPEVRELPELDGDGPEQREARRALRTERGAQEEQRETERGGVRSTADRVPQPIGEGLAAELGGESGGEHAGEGQREARARASRRRPVELLRPGRSRLVRRGGDLA